MKSLIVLGLSLAFATLTTGCCHNPCGYRCGRPMMFSGCSPCGSVSPCGSFSPGCNSCGSSGPAFGEVSGGSSFGPMMTEQYSEGIPMVGTPSPGMGPMPSVSHNPMSVIGSGEVFTQPLPPPLPSNGIPTPSTTIPVSSGPVAPMSYQTFQPQPFSGGQLNGYCPSCNH